jgi:hypothetical protein
MFFIFYSFSGISVTYLYTGKQINYLGKGFLTKHFLFAYRVSAVDNFDLPLMAFGGKLGMY